VQLRRGILPRAGDLQLSTERLRHLANGHGVVARRRWPLAARRTGALPAVAHPIYKESMMNGRQTNDRDRSARSAFRHSELMLAASAALLALAAGAAQARDDDDEDPEPRNGAYCTTTAKLLHSACGFEAKDDHFVARAKCINVSDARERAQCLAEAKQARAEAAQKCRAQFDGRRAACALLGEARYDPPFAPHLFDSDFRLLSNPNPYFPLGIGNRWEYAGSDERNVIQVTGNTKLIEGVTCIVLSDEVFVEGRLKEATDDWFAANRDGSTWYCGEEVKDYENFEGDKPRLPELVSNSGSFKQGRNRDKAGVIMQARPRAGQTYLEEFSLGNAEDVSEILSAGYSYGLNGELDRLVPRDLALRMCNRDCVVTKNYSLLEPGVLALKYYARGIGFFLEIKPDEGKAVQLVNCNFDSRCVGLPAP
jgi:hypothetical protein